ncbi:MAG: hypothetical protein Q7S65_00370 [Nanoarchaeota archaeon]|nr:hypothetical protein [Nanoarchaeota archaeon]
MKASLLLFLFLMPVAYGATLHGVVYDSAYTLVNDVTLVINTTPQQSYVAKSGGYFFYAPVGVFAITAEKYYQRELLFSHKEVVSIDSDGEYQIDIVLNSSIKIPPSERRLSSIELFLAKYSVFIYTAVILIATAVVIIVILRRKSKVGFTVQKDNIDHEENGLNMTYEVGEITKNAPEPIETAGDLETVLRIIKEEGGRATQKDIRRRLPLSEAKVSLMITELEAKGKVQKIKKGRGNIIVLK